MNTVIAMRRIVTEDYFKEHPDTLGTGHQRGKITFCRAPGGARAALGELLKKGAAFSKLNIIKWTKADVQKC